MNEGRSEGIRITAYVPEKTGFGKAKAWMSDCISIVHDL
jgi:hypothetical protein